MKNQIREIIIIFLMLSLTIINGFFLYTVLGAKETSLLKDQKKQTNLTNDLKSLKQAIDTWKERKPLILNETIATQEASLAGKLKLQILNGSGLSGKANTVKNNLSSLDSLLDIETGNTEATSSTILNYKNRVDLETKEKIKELLAKEFPQITEALLLDDSSFDLILILGTN